jgi:hypothetical protein
MRRAKLPGHDREDEAQAHTVTALRSLLAGLVDYAGLFPPAGLEMSAAVHNYAAYRAGDDAWILGRFVVPVSRFEELSEAIDALGAQAAPEWRLTAVAGSDAAADLEHVREFTRNARGRARVDSLEAKLTTANAIERVAKSATPDLTIFAEIPLDGDAEPLVAAVKRANIHAKVRTGGVTPESIPSPEAVLRFMRCCISAGVPFKATAGLHHPIRADYPLTYESGSPVGLMHGFLNVFLAAGFLTNRMTDADALELLNERDPAAFTTTPTTIRWRGAVLDESQIDALRGRVALSFGSCSFREPVEELRKLALLP